jgi:hypothetical protein
MPDAVGEGEPERAADDDPQDGAADIAAADAGAQGTGQAKSDKDGDERDGDPPDGRGSRMASSGSRAPAVNDSADAPAA